MERGGGRSPGGARGRGMSRGRGRGRGQASYSISDLGGGQRGPSGGGVGVLNPVMHTSIDDNIVRTDVDAHAQNMLVRCWLGLAYALAPPPPSPSPPPLSLSPSPSLFLSDI